MEIFNPFKYFTAEQYTNFWQNLFNTVLMGFWGRLFASLSLILAFWCGVVKEKIPLAIIFFSLTIILAHCGGAVKFVFWWLY
ncbi:MAG: hypothetical protein HY730_00125 [Candidatus Tectomicrobia bacterium]|uniref:Uncharacterized protein n=1 Tax=Tectimicrobiota bacterium TaxID=2528274 RepID=A0A933LPY5_UNCTE|nr:hypothetical protein [Candidatus Tectomicrobia bacterium]